MQATTRAKISRNDLMDYLHEDRDLLMGLQDDLIEEVTTACGWCIKSIDYDIQLKEDF